MITWYVAIITYVGNITPLQIQIIIPVCTHVLYLTLIYFSTIYSRDYIIFYLVGTVVILLIRSWNHEYDVI